MANIQLERRGELDSDDAGKEALLILAYLVHENGGSMCLPSLQRMIEKIATIKGDKPRVGIVKKRIDDDNIVLLTVDPDAIMLSMAHPKGVIKD